MEIIIKKSKPKGIISKENKTEWRNERRVKLLHSGKYNGQKYTSDQIAAMMYTKSNNIRQHNVEKMIKHQVSSKEMPLENQKNI